MCNILPDRKLKAILITQEIIQYKDRHIALQSHKALSCEGTDALSRSQAARVQNLPHH